MHKPLVLTIGCFLLFVYFYLFTFFFCMCIVTVFVSLVTILGYHLSHILTSSACVYQFVCLVIVFYAFMNPLTLSLFFLSLSPYVYMSICLFFSLSSFLSVSSLLRSGLFSSPMDDDGTVYVHILECFTLFLFPFYLLFP